MKKLYSFVLVAAVTMSAAAADMSAGAQFELRTSPVAKKEISNQLRQTGRLTVDSASKANKVTGMRKADGVASIEGLWTFFLGDYYFQNSVGPVQEDYVATLDGTTVTFTSPRGFSLDMVGTYDEAAATVTFSRLSFGQISGYYAYQQPYVYVETGQSGSLEPTDVVGSYEAGFISFEEDHGISWVAYESRLPSAAPAGYFAIFDLEGALYQGDAPEPEVYDEVQEGMWKTVGTASLVDAWILPSYSINQVQVDPNDFVIEDIELQQNVNDPNLYRLWKPFTDGNSVLHPQVNQSTYHGQIQFNISNPNHVEVVACGLPSGFKNKTGEFFLINEYGWYISDLVNNAGFPNDEDTRAFIIENLYGDEPSDVYDPQTGVITINNLLFSFEAACEDAYYWEYKDYSAVITSEALKDQSGVTNVEIDSNASVEYFNLQGIRVANPEQGQVVIKRQGTNVTKVLVK